MTEILTQESMIIIFMGVPSVALKNKQLLTDENETSKLIGSQISQARHRSQTRASAIKVVLPALGNDLALMTYLSLFFYKDLILYHSPKEYHVIPKLCKS